MLDVTFVDHRIVVAGAASLEEASRAAQQAAQQHSFVLVGEGMVRRSYSQATGWSSCYAFPYEPAGLG